MNKNTYWVMRRLRPRHAGPCCYYDGTTVHSGPYPDHFAAIKAAKAAGISIGDYELEELPEGQVPTGYEKSSFTYTGARKGPG
jgi:hypothetical protein